MTGYAINRTRQAFLGREVQNDERVPLLALAAGREVWMRATAAVRRVGGLRSGDALYLDRDHRVISIRSGGWHWDRPAPTASGVLQLPLGAAAAAETQVGDEIAICMA